MYKIDHNTAVASKPANTAPGTQGYFTEGDVGTGLPATVVTKDFLNGIQDELSNIVSSAGLVNDKADSTQVLQAMTSLFSDADTVDGYHASTTNAANTAAVRDANGDVTANSFRSSVPIDSFIPADADICYRVDTNANNEISFTGQEGMLNFLGFSNFAGGQSGYQNFPGGLLIQWMVVTANANTNTGPFNFPTAFPSACVNVQMTTNGGYPGQNIDSFTGAHSVTNTSFMVGTNYPNSASMWVLAIGY